MTKTQWAKLKVGDFISDKGSIYVVMAKRDGAYEVKWVGGTTEVFMHWIIIDPKPWRKLSPKDKVKFL